MALTATTLSAAITADALEFGVTAATGFAAGQKVLIDHEFIGQITKVTGTVITVRGRGDQGTKAVAHNILAPVSTTSSDADWMALAPGTNVAIPPDSTDFVTYGASGAIAVPDRNATIVLAKAGVGAMTLADPTQDMDGRVLNILSSTAQAHTVTNTTGYNGAGTTGDVATFGGAIGDNMTIKAVNKKWYVTDLRNVTLG